MSVLAHSLFAAAGLSAAKVDALFQKFNAPDAPGASVLVIQNGSILLQRSYGLANVEDRIPCAAGTGFRLASVSKQFTAMAIMMLAESNKLSLDQSLVDCFPEFPEYGRAISLRHLLSHTSGIIDYEDIIPAGTTLPVLDRDVLRLLMKQSKTYFIPGSKFRYSNSGYALLALVVEARSGQTFAHFLRHHIFEPLKMTHSLAYEQGSSVIAERAYGYSAEGDGFKRTDQSLTSSVLGDGGIYSCTADLLQWDQALDTGKLVSAAMQERAFSSATATGEPGIGYGFGWYVGNYCGLKKQWHTGSTKGFNSLIARFPEKKLTVIILANRSEAGLNEISNRLADLCLGQ